MAHAGNAFADFNNSFGSPGAFGTPGFDDSIFADVLETERNLPFQAALQRQNFSPNQLSFFQNQRQNIFDRFEGLLGQDILSGRAPDRRFTDFIDTFNFGQEFQQATPQQRGQNEARFNPRTTFLRR